MAWVRLDDSLPDHPKIVSAGPLASWLFVCGITYCNRFLTDGFIPDAQVRRLADIEDFRDQAERLVRIGLWEKVEGGYEVHDYCEYQPTRKKVEEERAKKVAAGQAGGQASASARAQARATPDGSAEVEAKSNPNKQPKKEPNPNPVPIPNSNPADEENDARARDVPVPNPSGFDAFYDRYPRKTGKQDAERAWQKLNPSPELAAEIIAAVDRQKGWEQWQSGVICHPATFLNGKRWQDEEPPKKAAANGRASPAKLSNYEISAANIDAAGEPDDPFGITGPIYETTGRIRR